MPRSSTAIVAFQQNNSGRSHVKRQTKQSRDKQYGRKSGKFQRAAGVDGNQQYHDGERDVEGEEDIQHQRRNGQNHHSHGRQYQQRGTDPFAKQPSVLF